MTKQELFDFMNQTVAFTLATVDGNERFDWNTEPHAHFICEHCGKVVDVGMQGRQESVYEAIRQNTGHVVHWHSLNFFGECSDCIFTKSVRLHEENA